MIFICRFQPSGEKIPIRMFLSNENGYYLDISMYKEDTDPVSGQVKFKSFGNKPGPLNGLLISTPYMTKVSTTEFRIIEFLIFSGLGVVCSLMCLEEQLL